MSSNSDAVRQEIVEVSHEVYQQGLVGGTGGNVSRRMDDRILITASGVSLGRLQKEDVSTVHLANRQVEGKKPSKELPTHLAVYAAFDHVRAIVHLHSFYSVCVGLMPGSQPGKDSMPPYTGNLVVKVGRVPLVPFLKPGTDELSQGVVDAMEDGSIKAVLLQNHGIFAMGQDAWSALYVAQDVEENARFHVQFGGTGRALTSEEIKKIG